MHLPLTPYLRGSIHTYSLDRRKDEPEVGLDNFEKSEIPHLYRESKDSFVFQSAA
jgi:hypothetical protein